LKRSHIVCGPEAAAELRFGANAVALAAHAGTVRHEPMSSAVNGDGTIDLVVKGWSSWFIHLPLLDLGRILCARKTCGHSKRGWHRQ
jgi:hypothetical protein